VATRQIPWPRIFAAGVAIVVSILLAFGIQGWWEGRQEQREEQEEQEEQEIIAGRRTNLKGYEEEQDRSAAIPESSARRS
jgi:hypothetical protein